MAYAFTKRFDEAEQVYVKYKDKNYARGNKPFVDGFIDDFKRLRKLGILPSKDPEINEFIARMEKLLRN